MEKPVLLRIEANSFYMENALCCFSRLQRHQHVAEAPACLESSNALISEDGHKHSSLLFKKINPSLFTNHFICQKTMGTESICFLNWRESDRQAEQLRKRKTFWPLADARSLFLLVCMNRANACQLRKVDYTIAFSVEVHFLKQRVSSQQLSMITRVDINGHGLSSDALQQIVLKKPISSQMFWCSELGWYGGKRHLTELYMGAISWKGIGKFSLGIPDLS